MGTLTDAERDHFSTHGWVRVEEAFSRTAAEQMREVVWHAIERRGILRNDRSTWVDAPYHLQGLRSAPIFAEIGTERTFGALNELTAPGQCPRPRDWGAFFVTMPMGQEWNVPFKTWHIDASWMAPLAPLTQLKVHALFGDVEPRGGGMTVVDASHRAIAAYFAMHPASADERHAKRRKRFMQSDPWLRDLGIDGDAPSRIARFHERSETVHGVPLRVIELTGAAGDVILIHPLILHTRPVNAGDQPRFLLNKDLPVSRDREFARN